MSRSEADALKDLAESTLGQEDGDLFGDSQEEVPICVACSESMDVPSERAWQDGAWIHKKVRAG